MDVLNMLLEARADPNLQSEDGGTALNAATAFVQVGMVRALLAAGADPNAGHSLHWVLKRCYDQTDESRYPSFGYDSRTPSMDWKRARSWTVSASSTQFGDSWSDWPRLDEVMMMLIEGGLTGVDGLDGDGLTPLIVAVMNGWPAAVQLLLSLGADHTLPAGTGECEGKTALELFQIRDHPCWRDDFPYHLIDAGPSNLIGLFEEWAAAHPDGHAVCTLRLPEPEPEPEPEPIVWSDDGVDEEG